MRFREVITLVLLCSVAVTAGAQTPAKGSKSKTEVSPDADGGTPHYIRPETPEKRQERLGTTEDPGLNPDPKKEWYRFGKRYKIERFEKHFAKYDREEGWVRPHWMVNFSKEIYQENDKWVWVWMDQHDPAPPVTAPIESAPVTPFRDYADNEIAAMESIRSEYKDLIPPMSKVRLRFEQASNGLPDYGSWRNSLAVGDFNEDGKADILLPPERGTEGVPFIFLGDGKGNWKQWDGLQFPYPINYGSVVAADFNGDHHLDIAAGVHLTGVRVFLGDGKGTFVDGSEGLAGDFPTRRVVAADVDGDGATDIVAITEGPVARGSGPTDHMVAFLNRSKARKWEQVVIADSSRYVGGDWLAAGNFNGDKYPDFVGASIYFNGNDLMYLSEAAKRWKAVGGNVLIPPFSLHFGVTSGKFGPGKLDDAVISYTRSWPSDLNPKVVPKPPLEQVAGIDRFTFSGKDPKRVPIVRWGSTKAVWGLSRGDFNGDGKTDIIYTTYEPREAVVLLGDGAGNFSRAMLDGLTLPNTVNYDLTVADVNGDRKPDVILMFEADEHSTTGKKNGSVQVFLNRGVVTASASK